ncbi:MAG TPA: hypothetical protein PLX04_01965 [Caldisericia bacterium]|nr:hypothetical protein [Caldisericia bacterium]HOR46632.1 hypothetical protein [Caldisericia bacterium]HOU07522.1 hypothetical protein [Caldisericia bacterium]HPL89014.1 hypothetical protein [Caldisericia bacterium]HQG59221.1 hypothetical protein [Caldisericia bacterium]
MYINWWFYSFWFIVCFAFAMFLLPLIVKAFSGEKVPTQANLYAVITTTLFTLFMFSLFGQGYLWMVIFNVLLLVFFQFWWPIQGQSKFKAWGIYAATNCVFQIFIFWLFILVKLGA